MNLASTRLTPVNLPLAFGFTAFFFLLVHLATLHFIFSLSQILSPGQGGIIGAFHSAWWITQSRLDLIAFAIFLAVVTGLGIALSRAYLVRLTLSHILYAFLALLFSFSYVQFILLFLHAGAVNAERWPGLSSFAGYFFQKPLWKSVDFLASFAVLWMLGTGITRLLWEWLAGVFLMVVFQVRRSDLNADFKRKVVEQGKSGSDFIDDFKTLIAYAHRQKNSLGLMGIKIKNEIDIIQKRGSKTYQMLLAGLFDASQKISRRGEQQLLYQSNIVLSVLFAGEKEAILAATRFEETLAALMREKFPDIPLTLAVGVIGKHFDTEVVLDISKTCEELFWGAGDMAAKAQDSGKIEISYRD